jgi:hypothetical protein
MHISDQDGHLHGANWPRWEGRSRPASLSKWAAVVSGMIIEKAPTLMSGAMTFPRNQCPVIEALSSLASPTPEGPPQHGGGKAVAPCRTAHWAV